MYDSWKNDNVEYCRFCGLWEEPTEYFFDADYEQWSVDLDQEFDACEGIKKTSGGEV